MHTAFKLKNHILLAIITLTLSCGCVYDRFNFESKTFTRVAILQDIAVQTVEYDPATGAFTVEGVDSDARFEAVAAAVEALR